MAVAPGLRYLASLALLATLVACGGGSGRSARPSVTTASVSTIVTTTTVKIIPTTAYVARDVKSEGPNSLSNLADWRNSSAQSLSFDADTFRSDLMIGSLPRNHEAIPDEVKTLYDRTIAATKTLAAAARACFNTTCAEGQLAAIGRAVTEMENTVNAWAPYLPSCGTPQPACPGT